MEDLTKLTDEELMAIANEKPADVPAKIEQHQDLNSLSDAQLQAIANGSHENTDPGLIANIVDAFTGNSKKTPTIEALPDWRGNMPEFSLSQGLPALKTALGTMATNPDETAKIIKNNFPDVQIKQDEKGNYIFKSGIDQNEYALKPGFRGSDIPRAAFQILSFLPAGKATSLLGAGLATGATQAAIEASQTATGGEFNPSEIGIAAVMGTAGEAAARIISAALPAAKSALMGKAFIPEEIAAAVPAVDPAIKPEDLQAIIEKASSNSWNAPKYQRQLAELARINPDALDVATKMGLEVPKDTFSDNPQVRELVGAGRSIVGSEESAKWREAYSKTLKTVDNALEEVGATPELSTVSQKTFDTLDAARSAAKAEAKANYDYVDSQIAPGTILNKPIKKETLSEAETQAQQLNRQIAAATGRPFPEATTAEFEGVGLPNLRSALEARLENAGSIKDLHPQEQKLLNKLNRQTTTYQDLIGIKGDLRRTLKGKLTDFSTLDEKIVEDLYSAAAKDQLHVAEQIGGQEAVDRLSAANLAWSKKRELDKTLVNSFGKQYEKDIAGLLRGTVTQGKQGSVGSLNKLLSVVPEQLQGEAVLSAISNASRSLEKDYKGQFDFAKFHDIWTRLKAEPEVFKKLSSAIKPDAMNVLNGLSTVSKYITTARTMNELATGKANQILKTMRATTWLGHLTGSVGQSLTAITGGSMFGPFGYGLGLALPKIISTSQNRIAAMGKLFNSPEFQKLTTEIASKSVPNQSTVNAFAKSGAFSKFAQIMRLPSSPASRVRWVKQAMMSQEDMNQPQAAFIPDRVVAEVLANGSVKTDPTTKFKIVQKPGGKYRLLAPDGSVSIHPTEDEAIKSATRKLRIFTNSPLR
jgi:hypothetical protein